MSQTPYSYAFYARTGPDGNADDDARGSYKYATKAECMQAYINDHYIRHFAINFRCYHGAALFHGNEYAILDGDPEHNAEFLKDIRGKTLVHGAIDM